jgi:hypothetical protein
MLFPLCLLRYIRHTIQRLILAVGGWAGVSSLLLLRYIHHSFYFLFLA